MDAPRDCKSPVGKHLVLALRSDDLVILDNLGSHKGKAVRRAIRQAGARLWFLPPYSLGLNSTEQAFAKIKRWMSDARQRTVEEPGGTWARSSLPSNPASARITSATPATAPPITDAI